MILKFIPCFPLSYSTLKAFTVILDQIDLIAREHEMMAEKLSERVGDKLKQLHKDCTNTRKNVSFLYNLPGGSSSHVSKL